MICPLNKRLKRAWQRSLFPNDDALSAVQKARGRKPTEVIAEGLTRVDLPIDRNDPPRLTKRVIGTLKEPLPYYAKPTPQDYNRGYFTRYVAKRRNSPNSIFLEIDQPTFNDLLYKGGVYNYPMWAVTSIFWQITGPLRDNKENKDFPRAGIIDTNKRILVTKSKAFPSIEKFFSNLTQFAVIESIEVISGQYTSGRELEYRSNEKEYIGYYHVRGNGDIFDGATTAQSKNMLLKPMNTTVAGSISLLLDKTLKELRAQNIASFGGLRI